MSWAHDRDGWVLALLRCLSQHLQHHGGGGYISSDLCSMPAAVSAVYDDNKAGWMVECTDYHMLHITFSGNSGVNSGASYVVGIVTCHY